ITSLDNKIYLKYTPKKNGEKTKFYEYEIDGHTLFTRCGTVGSEGRYYAKKHYDNLNAKEDCLRRISLRLSEGYSVYVNGKRAKIDIDKIQNKLEDIREIQSLGTNSKSPPRISSPMIKTPFTSPTKKLTTPKSVTPRKVRKSF